MIFAPLSNTRPGTRKGISQGSHYWFQKSESILARAKFSPLQKLRCEICKHMVNTKSFKSTTTQRTYFIGPENLKCSSENVVYLFTCKTCFKQYTGSTQDFLPRFNNYRCAHRNFLKIKK